MIPPRLAGQFKPRCDLIPDRGQTAWLWHAGGVDLVRCVQPARIASPAGPLPAWSVVLHGRCLIVPTDRLTPIPEIDRDQVAAGEA